MLKCIAIDDEPLALRQLTSYISKIPYLDLVAKYNNALEAQQMLAGEKVDLIFVDINMPDLNGVDFVRALIDRPMVIFTTAYSEYAVEGFKLDAVDYLLKPFSFADFSRSAAKANSLYELRHNQRPPQEGESEALPSPMCLPPLIMRLRRPGPMSGASSPVTATGASARTTPSPAPSSPRSSGGRTAAQRFPVRPPLPTRAPSRPMR